MLIDMVKLPSEPPRPPRMESKSIYVEVGVWERLAEIAAELGRSRSALVAGILRDWVRDYDTSKQGSGR